MNEVKDFMKSNSLSDPNRRFTLEFDEANLSLCTVEVVSIILTNLLALRVYPSHMKIGFFVPGDRVG